MKKIIVKTGLGYYTNLSGQITSKAELPAGDHNLPDDLFYAEVDTRAELDAIQIFELPADKTIRESEAKITKKVRALAIADLISNGELPGGYK